jgi:hypothetical protein
LTLGKGSRSGSPPNLVGVGPVTWTDGGELRLGDWRALENYDHSLRYGGQIGSVGQALKDKGRRWALVLQDQDAAAVAATKDGAVPIAYAATLDNVRLALQASLDTIIIAVRRPHLEEMLGALDPRSCTLVVSASTPGPEGHLGAFATSPSCGLGTGGLRSASTQHDHLVTLPDVSQTFLSLAGGSKISEGVGAVVSPARAVDTAALISRDLRGATGDRVRSPLVWLFVAANAFALIGMSLWPRARRVMGYTLLAIPAASYLMMFFPWWRHGVLGALVVGGAITFALAFGASVLFRRTEILALGTLCAVTAGVIALDALFRSPLEVDAPFGNSPLGAGRFFGIGNIASGVLVASLVIVAALTFDRWGRCTLPWIAGVLLCAVIIAGAPEFGADVGGVLFAVPAYGTFLLVYRQRRIKLRHLAIVIGATVATVTSLAIVDLAQRSNSQTHLAKNLHFDSMTDTLVRKIDLAAGSISAPMTLVLVVATLALVLYRPVVQGRPGRQYAAYALLVAAILGALLNDSGLAVAAAVAAVGWPVGVVLSTPRPSCASGEVTG